MAAATRQSLYCPFMANLAEQFPARFRLSPASKDRLIAAAYGLIGALALTSVDLANGQSERMPLWLVVVIVALTVVILRHRRRPAVTAPMLAVIVLLTLWLHSGVFAFVLLFEMVLGASIYGSLLVRCLVSGFALLVAAGLIVMGVVTGVSTAQIYMGALQNVLLVALALNWGASLRQARQHVDAAAAFRAAAEAEMALAATKERLVVASERSNLARDMHDIVAGRLSAIYLQASLGLRQAPSGSGVAALLQDIETCSADTLHEVRGLIRVLNPSDGESAEGLDAGVQHADVGAARLGRIIDSAALLGAKLTLEDSLGARGGAQAGALYLIAHEAVVNILRHAVPCTGRVQLSLRDDTYLLTVWNTRDLQGARPGVDSDHRGRGNMAARAAMQGGSARSGPTPDGEAWVVRAAIPVAPDGRIPYAWLEQVPRLTELSAGGTEVR